MILKNIRLRWQIFAYIFILSSFIILVFCIFQIFMLEGVYKKNKIDKVDSLIQDVESLYISNKENKTTLISNISSTNELGIYIISSEGNIIERYGEGLYFNSFTSKDNTLNIINKVSSNKVFYVAFDGEVSLPSKYGSYPIVNDNGKISGEKAIVSGKRIYINDIVLYLFLDARLEPVKPAVDALKEQLLYISIIVLVLSILFALLISNRISKPIKKMNDLALYLSKGNRNIHFTEAGFKEIYELNKTLNTQVEELNKSDQLEKEILANITHDLKTPLTLISGYAEMMKDIKETITEENLQVIIDEVARLNALVNDLVDLSNLQTGCVKYDMKSFNLTSLIISVVDRFNKVPNQVKIDFVYDDEVFIIGDNLRISQVLYNFINNAITHSDSDSNIKVVQSIESIKDEEYSKLVTITVIDNGIGLTSEEISVIWDRYTRLNKDIKRNSKGTGLGLNIVKEILEYHKFEYGVSSIKGEGSSFYFKIKIK